MGQVGQEAPDDRGHPEERRGATDSPLGPNNGIVADR